MIRRHREAHKMSIQDYIATLQVRVETLRQGDTFCIGGIHGIEHTVTEDPFPNTLFGDKTGLVIKFDCNGQWDLLTLPFGMVVYKTN
jgi:hypothetical protein